MPDALFPNALVFGVGGLDSAVILGSVVSAQATTWDRINRYLSLIKEAGIEVLVAQDCPAGINGGLQSRKEGSVDVWQQSSRQSGSGLGGTSR